MATLFGPTFMDELIAAGLAPVFPVFSWNSDGVIIGRVNLTTPQQSTLDAVIAAHNPLALRKNIVPFGVFIARWTDAEYALLMQRRATAIGAGNVTLVKQWDIAASLGAVDLNTQAAQNFKAAIVAAGILTPQRSGEVFS